jgi:AraC family transcriptional regulator
MVQVADYAPGADFGPRELRDFEFVWVLRGSAVWKVRQEPAAAPKHCILRPGTLALARVGTIDSYHWDDVISSTHAYVHFGIDPAALGPTDGWPATQSMTASPVLGGICDYLLQLATIPSRRARARSDQVLELLLDLFLNGPFADPEPVLHDYVVATIRAAQRAWRGGVMRILSAAEIAAAAGVSPGHLFRVFRAEFGCGPARALELIRLARSAATLQRSNASLAAVATQHGFANAYHFSRRFSQTYGTPPGTFRAGGLGPDPLEPLRRAGLLPFAARLMSAAPSRAAAQASHRRGGRR